MPPSLLLLLGLNLFCPPTAVKDAESSSRSSLCLHRYQQTFTRSQRKRNEQPPHCTAVHVLCLISSHSSMRAAEDEQLNWPVLTCCLSFLISVLLPFISASLLMLRRYSASSSLFSLTFHSTRMKSAWCTWGPSKVSFPSSVLIQFIALLSSFHARCLF